jgi:hypothetical protein
LQPTGCSLSEELIEYKDITSPALPAGVTFNATTRIYDWSAITDPPGVYSITVQATLISTLFVQKSTFQVNITAIPTPYILVPNIGPPKFSSPLSDITI